MFGAYPFGEPYFGQAPSSSVLVILFGAIKHTSLSAVGGVRRVLGLSPRRGIAGGVKRRLHVTHD
jgi:hypothetical protein